MKLNHSKWIILGRNTCIAGDIYLPRLICLPWHSRCCYLWDCVYI